MLQLIESTFCLSIYDGLDLYFPSALALEMKGGHIKGSKIPKDRNRSASGYSLSVTEQDYN